MIQSNTLSGTAGGRTSSQAVPSGALGPKGPEPASPSAVSPTPKADAAGKVGSTYTAQEAKAPSTPSQASSTGSARTAYQQRLFLAKRKAKDNAILDTFVSVFNSFRTLGISAGKFANAMSVLTQAGVVHGKTAMALQEGFSQIQKGALSQKVMEQLSLAGKELKIAGTGLTLVGGMLAAGAEFSKGNYEAVVSEVWKTFLAMQTKIGPLAAWDAALSLASSIIPGFANSKIGKALKAMNPLGISGLGVEAAGVVLKQIFTGKLDIQRMDQLVKKMKTNGLGGHVRLGEMTGENIYDIYQQSKSGPRWYTAYLPQWVHQLQAK